MFVYETLSSETVLEEVEIKCHEEATVLFSKRFFLIKYEQPVLILLHERGCNSSPGLLLFLLNILESFSFKLDIYVL